MNALMGGPSLSGGMGLPDDSALANTQLHQKLRQLMLLQALSPQQQQQQRPTMGLNPNQYPSLQAGMIQQTQQQNPLSQLMLLQQLRQYLPQQQTQGTNNGLMSDIGSYINNLLMPQQNAY